MGWSFIARARDLFLKHRRRLAPFVLLIGLAIIAVKASDAVPRDTQVSVPLGQRHGEVTEARIDYLAQGELAHTVTMRWPRGAPSAVRHDVELLPGDYDVAVRLSQRDGTQRRLLGHVSSPSDGVVQLALEDDL